MVLYYAVNLLSFTKSEKEVEGIMKQILFALMLMACPVWVSSCATLDAPSEPASTDTLEDRAEPAYLENKYDPEVEEEIESDEAPLATEEMEDKPLFK